ncbi:MAG TPA: PsbP-related protein [Nitrososphaeraceae archaeon]
MNAMSVLLGILLLLIFVGWSFSPIAAISDNITHSSPLPQQIPTNYTSYFNSFLGIGLQYPSKWHVHENVTQGYVSFDGPFSFIATTAPTTKVSIIPPLFGEHTLSDFIKDTISFYQAREQDFHIVQRDNTTLSGNPAQMIVYTWTDPITGPTKSIIISTMKNLLYYSFAYSFTPDGYGKQLPIINKMIDSFSIINPPRQPQTTTTTPLSFTTYSNFTFGISIQYPSNWIPNANLTSGIVKFTAPTKSFLDRTVAQARIQLQPLDNSSITTTDVVNNRISNWQTTLQGFHIVQRDNITLSGNPAQKIVYTFTDPIYGPTKSVSVFAIKNRLMYQIGLGVSPQSYSSYLPIINKMIDSLFIINPPRQPQTTTTTPLSFTTYSNSDFGISIQYPSNWQVNQNMTSGTIEFAAPRHFFLESVPAARLAIVGQPFNLHSAVDVVNNRISNWQTTLQGFHIVQRDNITLSGNPAQKIVYTFTDPITGPTKSVSVFAIKNRIVYHFGLGVSPQSYSSYLPIINKMIDSFEIISQPKPQNS